MGLSGPRRPSSSSSGSCCAARLRRERRPTAGAGSELEGLRGRPGSWRSRRDFSLGIFLAFSRHFPFLIIPLRFPGHFPGISLYIPLEGADLRFPSFPARRSLFLLGAWRLLLTASPQLCHNFGAHCKLKEVVDSGGVGVVGVMASAAHRSARECNEIGVVVSPFLPHPPVSNEELFHLQSRITNDAPQVGQGRFRPQEAAVATERGRCSAVQSTQRPLLKELEGRSTLPQISSCSVMLSV